MYRCLHITVPIYLAETIRPVFRCTLRQHLCSAGPVWANSGVVRIILLHFLAGYHKRWLNQAFSIGFLLCSFVLFITATFCVSLFCIGMCSLFRLFCLNCQYLPSDWLERLLWGSLIVARGSSLQSPGRRAFMIFLVYCIVSLFILCSCLVSRPCIIYFIFCTCVCVYSDDTIKPVCAESAVKHQ